MALQLALASGLALLLSTGCARHAGTWEEGVAAQEAGRYREAERIWLGLIEGAGPSGEAEPRVADSQRRLGELYVETGQLAKARPLLEAWVEERERSGRRSDLEFAAGLESLARLHRVEGDLPGAVQRYERVLQLREDLEPGDPLALVETLERLGEIHVAQRQGVRAAPLSERAIALRVRQLGPDHPSLTQTLLAHGTTQHRAGRFREARESYRRALAIADADAEIDDELHGILLHDFGALERATGDYEKARDLLVRAYEFRRPAGRNTLPVAATISELGAVALAIGRLKEAEALQREALRVRHAQLGADAAATASSFNNLALVLMARGRLDEAELAFHRALRSREGKLGPAREQIGGIYNNLGVLYRRQARWAESEQALLQAVTAFEQSFGPDHPRTASALQNLAEAQAALGRFAKAERLVERALSAKQRSYGPDHLRVADSLSILSGIQRAQGSAEQAEQSFAEAIDILSRHEGVTLADESEPSESRPAAQR